MAMASHTTQYDPCTAVVLVPQEIMILCVVARCLLVKGKPAAGLMAMLSSGEKFGTYDMI